MSPYLDVCVSVHRCKQFRCEKYRCPIRSWIYCFYYLTRPYRLVLLTEIPELLRNLSSLLEPWDALYDPDNSKLQWSSSQNVIVGLRLPASWPLPHSRWRAMHTWFPECSMTQPRIFAGWARNQIVDKAEDIFGFWCYLPKPDILFTLRRS